MRAFLIHWMEYRRLLTLLGLGCRLDADMARRFAELASTFDAGLDERCVRGQRRHVRWDVSIRAEMHGAGTDRHAVDVIDLGASGLRIDNAPCLRGTRMVRLRIPWPLGGAVIDLYAEPRWATGGARSSAGMMLVGVPLPRRLADAQRRPQRASSR